MQKTKLIELILRNLEELKELAGGIVADSEVNNKEIDLAIGIAKTLQIELEILKEGQNTTTLKQNDTNHIEGPVDRDIIEETIGTLKQNEKNPQNKEGNPEQEIESNGNFLNKDQIHKIIDEIKNKDRNTSIALTNLRNAIGLNDRYYFAKELFGNNMDQFISVIENIDKLDDLDQATDYLESIRLINNESSRHFIELVKRRF